jgi:hypothetical protein
MDGEPTLPPILFLISLRWLLGQHEYGIYFSNIYLYILTEEQKGKRRRTCDIALNAAENYNMNPIRNVMFARAADFLSPLKNSSSCVKN